jgi:hypothetical protein
MYRLLIILPVSFAVSILFAFMSDAYAFDMNDASVLLPLPNARDLGELLSPATQGVGCALLPREHFEAGGDLVSGIANAELYSKYLRVVAIRLDPCFVEGVGPKPCRKLVRFVWQPVFATEAGQTSTLDAAIHTFYKFRTASEWNAVVNAWPKLKAEYAGLPLQPSPQISSEGFSGSYWQGLKSLLLKSVGNKNLVRVTFMSLPFDNLWIFRGFDILNGERVEMEIPRIAQTRQTFALSLDPKKYEGGLDPKPPREKIWNIFLKDSDEIKVAGAIQEITDIADSLNNPKQHNAGTLDCVSCHVAQGARRWAENDWRFKDLTQFPNLYKNENANLENLTVSSKTNRIRAFGYFGKESAISQRVINETAEVVSALNQPPSRR